ncbi:MAG: hypothetical protein E7441_04685 [Ruminococcaceae bacterium]|nr:hypothetical protein [Oscillospiraceae bacterium]
MKTIVFLVLACIVIFCFAGCNAKDSPEHTGMPDPQHILTQKTVAKVKLAYGTEKSIVTLRKPNNAYFEILPQIALDALSTVSLKADDSSWRAEIFSTVYSESSEQNEAFAEYYFNGKLSDSQTEFDAFVQYVTDLGITHMGKPVKLIKSAYKKPNDKQTCEAYFVGFQFEDAVDGKQIGNGLIGFKIYMIDRVLSESELKSIFNQLFFIER